jgi:hypothetical protein
MLLMLDSSLPFDIWTTIVGFLELADLYGLLTTNKQIRSIIDQDVIYEQFAKRKYPLHLLDRSVYENSSWKELVQDDNAKNGYYRLQLNAVSFSRDNSGQRFYVNMIRSMAWDRKKNHVILEIEAFGENDLPEASRAAVFRLDPFSDGSVAHVPVVNDGIWCENYEHNGPSHQLCRIYLDANAFRPGDIYECVYSSPIRNHRICRFLPNGVFRSLPELFALEMPSLQQDQKRNLAAELPLEDSTLPSRGSCNFVSRSTPLGPSNVLKWKGVSLPQAIRERHGRGAWGAVQQEPHRSSSNNVESEEGE